MDELVAKVCLKKVATNHSLVFCDYLVNFYLPDKIIQYLFF